MRIFLLLLVLLSQTIRAEPLFYFHVGATWTYQVEGGHQETVTNRVSEIRAVNGKNWYKLIEYGEVFWVANSEKGQVEAVNFFEGNPGQLEVPEEILVFKYPAKIGETWNNNESPTTYSGLEKITVPAGSFECHSYYIDMGARKLL
ncbi:hypothetical protein [Teredinibacter turnerae]|uniref:hypothetical protein n=1 Tax=Teredinibacter turnerae TaxID=2426 RepID=UPI0012BD4213|nr:hypothetical protein [Teredinibacter turnerae]